MPGFAVYLRGDGVDNEKRRESPPRHHRIGYIIRSKGRQQIHANKRNQDEGENAWHPPWNILERPQNKQKGCRNRRAPRDQEILDGRGRIPRIGV